MYLNRHSKVSISWLIAFQSMRLVKVYQGVPILSKRRLITRAMRVMRCHPALSDDAWTSWSANFRRTLNGES